MYSTLLRGWLVGLLALSLATLLAAAGCSTIDHVDFPSDGGVGDDGGALGDDGSVATDGAACRPNDKADCVGYCGPLVGRCGKPVDCGACPVGLTCGAAGPNLCGKGECVPQCGGKTCGASDGCGGQCMTGACGSGQHCDAGVCVCDPTSCSGCCSGSSCLAGTTGGACGRDGAVCATCSTGTCSGGTCSGCTPSCSGASCGGSDGCGGTCTTGACGTGQRCSGGACVCDTSSGCTGCCSGSSCLPGKSATACGTGGDACATCSGTSTCTGGACRAPGGSFLSDCVSVFFTGCSSVCTNLGASCSATCGPTGTAGAETFTDTKCMAGAQWLTGDQCGQTLSTAYTRCCCK